MGDPGRRRRFYLSSFNHANADTCAEHFLYLRNGLAAAGYSASLSPVLERFGEKPVNILFDDFAAESIASLAAAHKAGIRIVLLAPEIVTGDTFNRVGSGPAATVFPDVAYWKRRYEGFVAAARFADAIWCLSDHQIAGYRALLPDKPIATMDLCFDPIEANCESELDPPKVYDVLFFGTVTPYRQAILSALRQQHRVLIVTNRLPRAFLHDLIRRTHICLHLGLSPDWPYTSNLRHHTLLMRRAYVLSEASTLPGELDRYVDICPREAILARVGELLQDPGGIAVRAAEARERYGAERPVAPSLQELVNRTLGVQPAQRA